MVKRKNTSFVRKIVWISTLASVLIEANRLKLTKLNKLISESDLYDSNDIELQ